MLLLVLLVLAESIEAAFGGPEATRRKARTRGTQTGLPNEQLADWQPAPPRPWAEQPDTEAAQASGLRKQGPPPGLPADRSKPWPANCPVRLKLARPRQLVSPCNATQEDKLSPWTLMPGLEERRGPIFGSPEATRSSATTKSAQTTPLRKHALKLHFCPHCGQFSGAGKLPPWYRWGSFEAKARWYVQWADGKKQAERAGRASGGAK